MNKIKYLLYLLLTNLIIASSFADDPFTRSLAEPEPVVEEAPTPTQEEAQNAEQNQDTNQQQVSNPDEERQGDIENIENILRAPDEVVTAQTPVTTQTETQNVATPIKEKVPVPKTSRDEYVSKIVNIDPISGHDIERYVLKGVAVSKIYNSNKKRRVKEKNLNLTPRKKIEFGNIPKTHIVLKDETVESIATKYGFTKDEIEKANALIPGRNSIIPGNRLVIPNRYHVVKEGETINIISNYYNLDASQIAAFNNLEIEEEIKIDQKLLLPFYLHMTEKKESIKEIAKYYRRTVEEILEANELEEPVLLDPNQYVKIPIHVNNHMTYQNLDIKSELDYSINPKNLAIVQIDNAQFMVREGDTLGNKEGKIVKIKSNEMTVVQEGREYLFRINAPLVGSAMASAPATTPVAVPAAPGEAGQTGEVGQPAQPGQSAETGAEPQAAATTNNQPDQASDQGSTDVEDLFR